MKSALPILWPEICHWLFQHIFTTVHIYKSGEYAHFKQSQNTTAMQYDDVLSVAPQLDCGSFDTWI